MKQIVTTIQVGVEGFSPIGGDTFLLALRWGQDVIALPISREAMKELKPKFGDILLIDLCIPHDPSELIDAPTS